MKLRISKNLIVLTAIVLSFVFTNNALAYSPYWTSSNYGYNNQPIPCNIESFEVSDTNINYNNSVILKWNTFGCNRVNISGLGNLSLNGETTLYPSGDTIYTLTARNSAGYVNTQSVKVYVDNYALNQNSINTQPNTPIVNNYYYPTTTKVVTANTVAPTPVTSTSTSNITNTTDTTNTSVKNNTNNNLGASAANSIGKGNSLTALSLGGSGSFMPSSIWQWMLVAVLILIIIIIIRTLTNKPAPGQDLHAAPHVH